MIELLEEYPYLYETHLHTSQASICAQNRGSEMARACKEAGYTGIFVTDHNWNGNSRLDGGLPWCDWVEAYAAGYEDAKMVGEEVGLEVYFAWEAAFDGTEFLILGLDKQWMLNHPELRTATIEEQYKLVHGAGGMVIHAHPFRKESYIPEIRLFPEWVDGVEGINATHSNSASLHHNVAIFDELAIQYARQHQLPLTAGSDIHRTSLLEGGMAFRRKFHSGREFVQAFLQGEDYMLTNGEHWFRKNGERL